VSPAVETLAVQSRALCRTLPCTLLRPTRAAPTGVLYLLHGGHSHHGEWAERMDLQGMASHWPLALALPEGGFSLWVQGHDGQDFERYAAWEVPQAVEDHLGLHLPRAHRAVAGISMGGLGAFHLGLSHPERYGAVGSLSGAFGMTWWNLGLAPGSPFLPALGPLGSPTRSLLDPWRTLERALLRVGATGIPPLYLLTGTEDDDEVTLAHRSLVAALDKAGVSHLAAERPGGHDWDFWARETPALLSFIASALGLPGIPLP
jgi:putative tributyrin esterase